MRQLAKMYAIALSAENEGMSKFSALVSSTAVKKSQEEESCRKHLIQDFRDAVMKSLPQDAFLVPDLVRIPEAEGVIQEPFVVLLRFPFSLLIGSLSCTAPEYKRQEMGGLRIGRFAPVIKYAISQQFGMLYARIGLPSSYENNQKLSVELWDALNENTSNCP